MEALIADGQNTHENSAPDFQSRFGCRHRQLSRVFTIKKQTYKVCYECGQEFEYSWARMHSLQPKGADHAYAPRINAIRHDEVSAL
jgi:hypothetical protein